MGFACPKDLRDLIKTCEKRGWVVERTNGDHIRWRHPSGQTLFTAQTPSDWRAIRNIKTWIRNVEAGKTPKGEELNGAKLNKRTS